MTTDSEGRVTFSYKGKAKNVSVKGDFNEWQTLPLLQNGDHWKVVTEAVSTGTYGYRTFVDGIDCGCGAFNVGDGDYPKSKWEGGPLTPLKRPSPSLTVIAFNTHSLQTPIRRFAKLDEMAKGLAYLNADIVCLNEVVRGRIYARGYEGKKFDTAEYLRRGISHWSGKEHHMVCEGWAKWDKGEELGNAILTPHKLDEVTSTPLTTRDFWPAPNSSRRCLCARVTIPQMGTVRAFVAHLMGYDYPDTPIQINEVKRFVETQQKPGDLGSVIAGDFNVSSSSTANYEHLVNSTPVFTDTYWTANGAGGVTAPDCSSRIDYVFWCDGAWKAEDLKISSQTAFTGKALAEVVLPVVSDHYAVVTTLS